MPTNSPSSGMATSLTSRRECQGRRYTANRWWAVRGLWPVGFLKPFWRYTVSPRRRAFLLDDAGFTLIELLVVLAILGLLAGLTAPRVIGYLGGAKSQAAEVQLASLATALDLFHLEVGRYPSEQEGLTALLERPPSADRWNGPYVRRADELQDPWERLYQYRFPGEHGAYDLVSYGADGTPGGDGENGDVVSW